MKNLGMFITIIVLFGIFIIGLLSLERVPQGNVGVVFSLNDGVQDTTLNEGMHFISPFHEVTVFPVSTETVDVEQFNVMTRDGKALGMQMSYDFSVNPEMVSDVFVRFRGQNINAITSSWLQDRAQRSAIAIFSRYSIQDVFRYLPRIQQDIFEEMQAITAEYGFNVQSVTLQSPEMDEATLASIQSVIDSQQELERMAVELQQAEVRANTRIEEARGRAESTLLEAQAQAEANELLQESLTQELIDMEIARAWNGELPMITGSNSNILDVSSILGE